MGLPSNSGLDHLPIPSTANTPGTGSATLSASVNSAVSLVPGSVSSRNPSHVALEKTAARSSVPSKRKHPSDGIESMNPKEPFMSQIFDVYVGAEKRHFTAHEEFLARSPRLKLMCSSKNMKRHSKGATNLIFPFENPNSFSHLLQYLYLSIIAVPPSEPLAEARQLAELFSVARKFQLDEMQEDIISRLDTSEMSSRISTMEFFSLAEDLFLEGVVNSLLRYFLKVAPSLIKTLDEEHLPELERMVADGGDFAQALFAAYRETYRLNSLEDDPKTQEELKEELSIFSDVKTEMEPEIKDEPGTKKVKVSPPSWDNLSEADKILVRLRAETGNWNQISQKSYKATGVNASIKELLARYSRITADWWQLKNGDKDRLIAAEAQVEAKFRSEMWATIADVMVEKGADRYPPSFLRKTYAKIMEAEKASDGAGLTRWRVWEL